MVRTALDKVYSEIKVMRDLAHPNCIRLFAIFDEGHADGKLYLVLEYAAKGAIMDWDSAACSYFVPGTKAVIPEGLAKGYVCDVLAGLGYLHDAQRRVAH